jgi:hypothetical protein
MPIEWQDSYGEWSQRYRLEDDGTFHRATFMDAEPVVDAAKAEHNAGFGSSPSGDLKKVASIPMGLWLKWKMEEGVDILQPGNEGWLRRKLDDPELMHLRVWKGQLGKYHE